jgi:hypothetical protein
MEKITLGLHLLEMSPEYPPFYNEPVVIFPRGNHESGIKPKIDFLSLLFYQLDL